MSKSRSFLSILIPSATVFFSSACIMVLELVAGRLIARHLGSSLYTWTSVIGVVLTGVTIGNYLGGRVADYFPARKTLAVLFGVSSVACVLVVILNNLVGEWIWLWQFSWPVRVFSHVSLVFLVPSTLLGTVSPVVAKMALDRGFPTGRTIGQIYAWGAAGSIFGTFLAGFYLIAAMGTIAIIWTVGAVLLLMAILYWARLRVLYVWAAIFIALSTMGMAPADWARNTGSSLGLREKPDPNLLYEDESQYCYIAVKRISINPEKRAFMQDKLKHSEIIMGDINNLQYFQTIVFAGVTHALSEDKEIFTALHIGGGGYVFPQYIEKNWPGSRNDVVEIDPGVTEAAMQAFGLRRDTTINTFAMDARNYVDELLAKQNDGQEITKYDFIYEDAINDYSVPYQLVTKEFNDKILEILTDDGVYLVNTLDIYDSGRFVGTYINTLEQTFPNVYVIAERTPRSSRTLFVLIAAKKEMDPEKFVGQYGRGVDFWCLNNSEIELLKQKSRGRILTDNYVPVENMLAPVVRRSAAGFLAGKYLDQARILSKQGKFEESITKYEDLIRVNPTQTIVAYNNMGLIMAKQGKTKEAIELFQKAVEINEKAEIKTQMPDVRYNLGQLLNKVGKSREAAEQFNKAVEDYRKELIKKPGSVEIHIRLSGALAEIGNFRQAGDILTQAVALEPLDSGVRMMLGKALELQGRIDEAIVVSQEASEVMSRTNRIDLAMQFKKYIEYLEHKKQPSK